jgi:hypothetical protein
MAGPKGIF